MIAPKELPSIESLYIIIQTPMKAIIIDSKVTDLSFSPNNKYPKIAAINGIAANMKRVTAAVVIFIEKMNPINAILRKIPPNTPDIPTLKKFL